MEMDGIFSRDHISNSGSCGGGLFGRLRLGFGGWHPGYRKIIRVSAIPTSTEALKMCSIPMCLSVLNVRGTRNEWLSEGWNRVWCYCSLRIRTRIRVCRAELKPDYLPCLQRSSCPLRLASSSIIASVQNCNIYELVKRSPSNTSPSSVAPWTFSMSFKNTCTVE